MRISELREYSQRDLSTTTMAREVSSSFVPNAAASAALTRRSYTNGLAMSETAPRRQVSERMSGLGELVQVVT